MARGGTCLVGPSTSRAAAPPEEGVRDSRSRSMRSTQVNTRPPARLASASNAGPCTCTGARMACDCMKMARLRPFPRAHVDNDAPEAKSGFGQKRHWIMMEPWTIPATERVHEHVKKLLKFGEGAQRLELQRPGPRALCAVSLKCKPCSKVPGPGPTRSMAAMASAALCSRCSAASRMSASSARAEAGSFTRSRAALIALATSPRCRPAKLNMTSEYPVPRVLGLYAAMTTHLTAGGHNKKDPSRRLWLLISPAEHMKCCSTLVCTSQPIRWL